MTLVDLLIATTVLVIGVLGTIGTLQATTALSQATRETTLGYQAARGALEDLQAQPFDNLFRRFNADPADDPAVAIGDSPGEAFQVDGINLQVADGDNLAGRLIFPVDALGVLREDFVDANLGMPRDLNGDGVIDGDNRIDDHIVLPVSARVEWTGNTGDRFVEFKTILRRKE